MLKRTTRPLALSALLATLLALSAIPPAAAAPPGEPLMPGPVAMSLARADVTRVLSVQAVAWNRNDLPAFVASYAEDATFLTPTGLVHGRQAVLAHYQKRYPDGKAMGVLTLNMAEVRPLSVDVASGTVNGLAIVASWKLAHPDDEKAKASEGYTLLVLQRRGGKWEILQDASL